MNISNVAQLQQFIACNNIDRVNGILIFEGLIRFNKYNNESIIRSEVQVITLPESSAIYILEFFKDEYGQNEMYSTDAYEFTCTEQKTLWVSNEAAAFTMEISLASSR